MNKLIASTIAHTIEAVVAGSLAIALASAFPEYRIEIGMAALALFSSAFKINRALPTSPVPDYANLKEEQK